MKMRKNMVLALSVTLILSALLVFTPASSAETKVYKWKLFAFVNYSEWMCRELRDTGLVTWLPGTMFK